MADWPRPYNPVGLGGQVNAEAEVELFQHTALNTLRLAEWCGGEVAYVNGGPLVIVGGTRRAAERLCGLGDFAVRDGDRWWAEPADGIYQRFQPVDS